MGQVEVMEALRRLGRPASAAMIARELARDRKRVPAANHLMSPLRRLEARGLVVRVREHRANVPSLWVPRDSYVRLSTEDWELTERVRVEV